MADVGLYKTGHAMKKLGLDQNTLDDIIQRVVEVAQPQRIILFGSAVRGAMTRHSDVDLLIVKEGGARTQSQGSVFTENLYMVLSVAVDAIRGLASGCRTLQE